MATTEEIKAEAESLKEECLKFAMLELPGQPRMMHMGTSYLVSRLQTALKRAIERIDALEDGTTPARSESEGVQAISDPGTSGEGL